MFGNMGLRAEMAKMEDRIGRLEAVTNDQWRIIDSLERSHSTLIDEMIRGLLMTIPSRSDDGITAKKVQQEDVIKAILNHLGLDAEEVKLQSHIRLVKKRPKEAGE